VALVDFGHFRVLFNVTYVLIQGSLSRVYVLLITRVTATVTLKINGGMWLIVYDQQSIYSGLICFLFTYVEGTFLRTNIESSEVYGILHIKAAS